MRDGCMLILKGKDELWHYAIFRLNEFIPDLYRDMAKGFSGTGNEIAGGSQYIPASKMKGAEKKAKIATEKKNNGEEVNFEKELSEHGFKKTENDYLLRQALNIKTEFL
jgi:hypothetical protein